MKPLKTFFAIVTLIILTMECRAVQLFPGMGLTLHQLDLTFPEEMIIDSRYGLAVADFTLLASSTGISTGYINVISPAGWVVRNLPVNLSSGYGGLSVMFDLGSSGNISSMNVYAEYSESPVPNFTGVLSTLFSVGQLFNNARGEGTGPIGIGIPTDLSGWINFISGGLIDITWQPNHPNIEQYPMQCGPAAAANSFEYLRRTRSFPVPWWQQHIKGIGYLDYCIVGPLGHFMEHDPITGLQSPRNFLNGKLDYIDHFNLYGGLSVKLKQRPDYNELDGDFTRGSVTSFENRNPNISLLDWIISELKHGENVELRIGWDETHGHIVDLTGAGYILGVPWVSWAHDAHQDQVSKNPPPKFLTNDGGTGVLEGGYQFSPVIDNKMLCYINHSIGLATIDFAVSESYDGPLPVELSSFVCASLSNAVELNWTTSSELNNYGFDVERSMNNNGWTTLGFVKGNGTTNSTSNYKFVDKNPGSGKYHYRLKQIDFNGNFEYFELPEAVTVGVPDKFFLEQNYPNPFNPVTTIAYGIPVAGNVKLRIFDMSGREIKTIVNEFKDAGYYTAKFDASGMASGAYVYRIESGNFVSVKKMMFLK